MSPTQQQPSNRPSFDDIVHNAQRRLAESGASPVSWDTTLAARQYRPLFDELSRYRSWNSAEPQQLLDWGAGRGIQMGVAADLGYNVTGLEFKSPELMGSLRLEFGERIDVQVIDEPRRLPFDSATFDVVLSMGVLEHVRETGGTEAASLAEITRVLRPGGKFICLHFPQSTSWVEFFARHLHLPIHHHQYRYSVSDVEAIMATVTPLRTERQWRYGFLPRNQAARAFRAFSNNPRFANAFDRTDAALSRALPIFCTNHGFVATSPT